MSDNYWWLGDGNGKADGHGSEWAGTTPCNKAGCERRRKAAEQTVAETKQAAAKLEQTVRDLKSEIETLTPVAQAEAEKAVADRMAELEEQVADLKSENALLRAYLDEAQRKTDEEVKKAYREGSRLRELPSIFSAFAAR